MLFNSIAPQPPHVFISYPKGLSHNLRALTDERLVWTLLSVIIFFKPIRQTVMSWLLRKPIHNDALDSRAEYLYIYLYLPASPHFH